MTTRFLFIFASLIMMSAKTYAWGPRGHAEINSVAVRLLESAGHPTISFLAPNRDTLRRLSQTPDSDWKKLDKREKLLHYFEADAFARTAASDDAILNLPTGDYNEAQGKYGALLLASTEYLTGFGRRQNRLEDFGTAPWRILQLYDTAVSAFRAHDFEKALLCLGTLGHYVGEMSQPLHTTMHYDGEYYPQAARGVHDAIESEGFESLVNEDDVLATAKDDIGLKGLDGFARERVIPEVFKLIHTGYATIEPLLAHYAEIRRKDSGRAIASTQPRGLVSFARDRFALAALLTARLWSAAWVAGGSPVIGPRQISFKDLNVTGNYLPPSYLPPR